MLEKNKSFLLEFSKEVLTLLDGKIVIVKPTDTDNIVPLFCKCCSFSMKTIEDSMSFRKKKVCNKCLERWFSYDDAIKEAEPDKTTPEWNEYIETRLILERPKIKMK
jgi:hypothetical protein